MQTYWVNVSARKGASSATSFSEFGSYQTEKTEEERPVLGRSASLMDESAADEIEDGKVEDAVRAYCDKAGQRARA